MAIVNQALSPKPLFLQAATGQPEIDYSADEFRAFSAAIWPRPGVLGVGHFQVLSVAANSWQVTVQPGYAAISNAAGNRRWVVSSDTPVTLDLSGFNKTPPSARSHAIYLCVYDNQVVSNFENTARGALFASEDTTGNGGPAPDEPVGLISLATLLMGPASTGIAQSNINDARAFGGNAQGYSTTSLALAAGFNNARPNTEEPAPSVQYRNGQCVLQGSVIRTSGVFEAGNSYNIGTIASAYQPRSYRNFTIATGANTAANGYDVWTARLTVSPSGAMVVALPGDNSPQWIYLDGVQYSIDS